MNCHCSVHPETRVRWKSTQLSGGLIVLSSPAVKVSTWWNVIMIKRSNGSLMSTHFVARHNIINVFPSPSPTGLSCHSLRTWWDGLLVYPPIWQDGHNTNINKVTQIQGLLHICLYNIDVLVFSYKPDLERPKGERPQAPLEPIAYDVVSDSVHNAVPTC